MFKDLVYNMRWEIFLFIFTNTTLIFGVGWRLATRLSHIETKIDMHIEDVNRRLDRLEEDCKEIKTKRR